MLFQQEKVSSGFHGHAKHPTHTWLQFKSHWTCCLFCASGVSWQLRWPTLRLEHPHPRPPNSSHRPWALLRSLGGSPGPGQLRLQSTTKDRKSVKTRCNKSFGHEKRNQSPNIAQPVCPCSPWSGHFRSTTRITFLKDLEWAGSAISNSNYGCMDGERWGVFWQNERIFFCLTHSVLLLSFWLYVFLQSFVLRTSQFYLLKLPPFSSRVGGAMCEFKCGAFPV